ncbi:MAG: hypothetical protein LBF37_03420 [Rickettsiales bacterium]|jgi:hypothetical protein|nr:hypothetical protein [Rickettsiales bacterium]
MKVKWTKFYDWRVVALDGPTAFYGEFQPGKTELFKYDVKITYKYHGTKTVSFYVGTPLVFGPVAYRAACDYYNNLLIKNRNEIAKYKSREKLIENSK